MLLQEGTDRLGQRSLLTSW